jgi:serine/threonine protein kinase/tetratricopeptide (TPR) repeat protein
MADDPCPGPDVLSQFLGEQLDPGQQAQIGTHVDRCEACQSTLEELTDRRGYHLGLDTEPASGLAERDAEAGDLPQHDDVEGSRVERPQVGDTGRGITADTSGESKADCRAAWAHIDATALAESPGARDPRLRAVAVEFPTAGDDEETDPYRTGPSGSAPESPFAATKAGWRAFPGYEVLERLGQGGMGVVYKARQVGLNRLVALKTIRCEGEAPPDLLARFRIEAQAVARLKHANIVQIYEVGEADGLPFLSLELLAGSSLDDRLAGNPQPAGPSAEMLVTLARAVQVAHDANIVHRDLKPSNVRFGADGIPKITDFGLARLTESDSRQTESGQIMGSPSYMAPEQASGSARHVGPAADIYALGAILYEMLTGRPPFKGETPIETVRQVREDEVVPPSRLVPKLAHDLETICLQCLNKEPGRRYRSAHSLAEDLENFLAGRPVNARRTPFWERGAKLARRHPVAATVVGLVVLTTAGSTAAWLDYSSRETARTAQLRSRITDSLFKIQYQLANARWVDAERDLTGVQAEIPGERDCDDLARRTAALLAQAREGRADAETKSEGQRRLQTFRKLHRDTLFQQTHFIGIDLPYDQRAVVNSARAALAVFAAPQGKHTGERSRAFVGQPFQVEDPPTRRADPPEADRLESLTYDTQALGALPETFTPQQRDEIKEDCFELLLILADAEVSPEQGLKLLDEAGRLRPATRAYHLRLAECLGRRGDAAGAQRERQKAETVPLLSALDYYLMGKEMHKRGSWAAAIPHFNAALLIQPGHFWSHCLAAICSLQLQRPDPARSELTACLQAEPGLPWLYELRGFASYQIASRTRAAVETMQARGQTLRTEIHLQLQAAETDYEKALKLLDASPNDAVRYAVLVNRGLLWLERRDWAKAEADLQSAIRLDDRRWNAIEVLAGVYARDNKPDLAIEQFSRAINLRPGWAPFYHARAAVNIDRKEQRPVHRASALADLDQAIRLEPPGSPLPALYHALRAKLLHREAREVDALAACDTALATDPGNVEALRQRVNVVWALERYGEVIRSCNALLARSQPTAELYERRGLSREKIGEYEPAIEDLTLAIALRPATASLLARRGALYLITDAPRSALRDFAASIRLDSSNPDALLGRGLAQVDLGQHREAVADAARALAMGDPNVTALYNAARIYARAAVVAAAEARRTGQGAVVQVTHYQDEAVTLLGEWLGHQPAAKREESLRELLQDPAMATLRRRLRSL